MSGEMSTVMKDLPADIFCVPIIYKNSPMADILINEVHWHSKAEMHSAVETVWRYVLKIGFISFARDLMEKIKIQCERCRYLRKKAIDAEMGPISEHSITIAPAFCATQADICGPFKAYSLHHKRTTVKIWLIIYCCISTSTTNIKVMDNYSAQAFIQAFTRFSGELGYPKLMVIDEGSQLIKGCDSLRISFTDIKRKLHRYMMVDFTTCPVGGNNYNGKVERRIKHKKNIWKRQFQINYCLYYSGKQLQQKCQTLSMTYHFYLKIS